MSSFSQLIDFLYPPSNRGFIFMVTAGQKFFQIFHEIWYSFHFLVLKLGSNLQYLLSKNMLGGC